MKTILVALLVLFQIGCGKSPTTTPEPSKPLTDEDVLQELTGKWADFVSRKEDKARRKLELPDGTYDSDWNVTPNALRTWKYLKTDIKPSAGKARPGMEPMTDKGEVFYRAEYSSIKNGRPIIDDIKLTCEKRGGQWYVVRCDFAD